MLTGFTMGCVGSKPVQDPIGKTVGNEDGRNPSAHYVPDPTTGSKSVSSYHMRIWRISKMKVFLGMTAAEPIEISLVSAHFVTYSSAFLKWHL